MKKSSLALFLLGSAVLMQAGCGPQQSSSTADEVVASGIVANNSKLWENGSRLRVLFLDGSAARRARVTSLAKEWEKYGNIHFDFVESPPAEIRVTFRDSGNHATLGTDALRRSDQKIHTLSLSALSADQVFSDKTILHELGHALGIEHEHLSPVSALELDREKILKDCFFRYGLKRDVCEHAIFQELDREGVTAFDFDPHSVMGYDFHDSHYKDGSVKVMHIGGLSIGDRLGIARVYPGKKTESEILIEEVELKNKVSQTEKCQILKNVCARESYMVQYNTVFGNKRSLGVCTKNFYEALSTMVNSSKCK